MKREKDIRKKKKEKKKKNEKVIFRCRFPYIYHWRQTALGVARFRQDWAMMSVTALVGGPWVLLVPHQLSTIYILLSFGNSCSHLSSAGCPYFSTPHRWQGPRESIRILHTASDGSLFTCGHLNSKECTPAMCYHAEDRCPKNPLNQQVMATLMEQQIP